MPHFDDELELLPGETWEAEYCQGDWGDDAAEGSQYAGRQLLEVTHQEVAYRDRAGEFHRTTPELFRTWVRSQRAAKVERAYPHPDEVGFEGGGGERMRPRRGRKPGTTPSLVTVRGEAAMRDFVTIAQAAAEVGVTAPSLYYHIRRGALDASRVGRGLAIRRDQWEAFKTEWVRF